MRTSPKTLVPKARIVELKLDSDVIEWTKTNKLVEKAENDAWKVKGPLTGPAC